MVEYRHFNGGIVMSPNDADWPAGPAHRQAAEAPVSPDRGFSAFAARWSGARGRPVLKMTKLIPCEKSPLMALDPDAERVLEMVRLSGRPSYETLSAPEARESFLAAREVLAPDPPPVAVLPTIRPALQGLFPKCMRACSQEFPAQAITCKTLRAWGECWRVYSLTKIMCTA